ncbi:SWIM zinc finger family protein [Anaerolineales bacterium HSG24]|nr:SWIM zinc finger family protein [Anaerolineales bacterium HSG24]
MIILDFGLAIGDFRSSQQSIGNPKSKIQNPMSRYDYYTHFYKPTKAIETDKGIKARSKRGAFASSWWATRWIKALEKLMDSGRLGRGRTYARKGQVLSIKEITGGVEAKVQGSRRTPYKVSIKIDTLSDNQWEQVIESLFNQAIFTAQLLNGDMPDEIESVFKAARVSLFPDKKNELNTNCSCPDWANPCKHIAAAYYLLGEQFDDDPFMIFRLRGRSKDDLLQILRGLQEIEEEDWDEEIEEEVIPLSETIDQFYSMSQPIDSLVNLNIKPPLSNLPILKRLGEPSFVPKGITPLLGSAYQQVSERAIRMAEGEDEGEA